MREFTLLSVALQKVREDALVSDAPVYRQWYARSDAATLDKEAFDEAKLVEMVRGMLANTGVFLTIPPSIEELRVAHERAEADTPNYLRFALTEQQKRLKIGITSFEYEKVEKKLRNVKRGLARVNRELDYLLSTERTEYTVRKAAEIIERALQKAKDKGAEDDATVRRILDSFESAVQSLRKIDDEKMDKLADEYIGLLTEQISLEPRVIIKNLLVDLLKKTELKLTELGGQLPGTTQSSGSVMVKAQSDSSGARTKVKTRPNGATVQVPVETQTGAPGQPERNGPVAATIKKIRDIIMRAQKSTQKIRILMPDADNRITDRLGPHWMELLNRLNFNGEIEFVGYAFLNTTPDTETPIIVSRMMNTHIGREWNKARHRNIAVIDISSPRLMLNYLDSANGS